METTQCNAMMAQKQLTVTYTVEEAIKIAEVYDMMLSNLARDLQFFVEKHLPILGFVLYLHSNCRR